jgi:hypothetical protein
VWSSYITSITTWAERGLHNTACHNWSYSVFNRCWCSLNSNAHRNYHKKLCIGDMESKIKFIFVGYCVRNCSLGLP